MATEQAYEVDNLIYNIVTTEEEHAKLKNDPVYLLNFLRENAASLEFEVPNNSRTEEETAWNKKSVMLLLSCLRERKKDLRNPKIEKMVLWKEIRAEMLKNGYGGFDENAIERKFRNMKKTHKVIKDNKKKSSTGRGEVKWEYFDAMEEIFKEDRSINLGHTLSSASHSIAFSSNPSTSTVNFESQVEIEETLVEAIANTIIRGSNTSTQGTSSTSTYPDIAVNTAAASSQIGSEAVPGPSKKAQKGRQLYGLRKRQLEIDEKRVEKLQKLVEAVEENNKIQKERNELLKQFLEKQK